MNIIEQATRRLEELQRAGIQVPWDALPAGARPAPAPPVPAGAGDASVASPIARLVASAAEAAPVTARSGAGRASREVSVDLTRLANLGYVIPGQERNRWADEFRAVKRPILANARAAAVDGRAPANLVMVTSAMPAEGKTLCAMNLALSIASEVDTSVLLVDADVLRPSVLERMGIVGSYPGLLDVLEGSVRDLGEVLLKPNIPKLTLLPAGTARRNAAELLASDAMLRLLEDIARRYPDRIIVFDAPPLLVTSESRVLAARMGQLLMVVRENRTTAQQIAAAFAAIESVPIVLSVLNGSSGDDAHSGYAGGYGYY